MSVTPIGTRPARVYMQIKQLPPACRPAWVVRHAGATLMIVDPRSTRGDVTFWVPDHLTEAEMNAFRAAYLQPPVGSPIAEHLCSDDPVVTDVPEALRLPSAAAPTGNNSTRRPLRMRPDSRTIRPPREAGHGT